MPGLRARLRLLALGAGALAALSAAGCGADTTPAASGLTFGGAALQTLSTDDGALGVVLRTAPQPPERGMNAAEYRVTAASGEAIDGLQLTVVPWMPDMGHGTSLTPQISARGAGVYVVDNLSLFMAGRWQLRTRLAGAATGNVAPEFEIQ